MEVSNDQQEEAEFEQEEAESEEEAGGSGQLKWKENLVAKAAEAFMERQKTTPNLRKLVYDMGTSHPLQLLSKSHAVCYFPLSVCPIPHIVFISVVHTPLGCIRYDCTHHSAI